MLVEVYGNEKPASPRRALGASVTLFIGVGALAAAMARERGGDPLGTMTQPDGWSASFRPPRRFQVEPNRSPDLGLPYIAHGLTRRGSAAILAVYRLDGARFDNASSVCDSVIRMHLGFPRGLWATRRRTRMDRLLGGEQAVEVVDENAPGVARAVILPSGEAYAVWLGVQGHALDSHTYRLFELTCASFEFQVRPER